MKFILPRISFTSRTYYELLLNSREIERVVNATIKFMECRLFWCLAILVPAAAAQPAGTSVLAMLSYNKACTSTITLENLGNKATSVEIEGHRSSGALVALTGQTGRNVRLTAGQKSTYKLQIEEDPGAWAVVRDPNATVAVGAVTECLTGNELTTFRRDVAYAMRNPWFAGDVSGLRGQVILVLNTTPHAAKVSACYSNGNLTSGGDPNSKLTELCSAALDVQIPPFGSREFPVDRSQSNYFSLKTRGEALILQMLKPAGKGVATFTVNSTVTFGAEAPN